LALQHAQLISVVESTPKQSAGLRLQILRPRPSVMAVGGVNKILNQQANVDEE
jgi:hypothetical protein